MSDKKYQVFVSSTFTDLEKERAKVFDTILTSLHFPVGMELFSSSNDDQWKVIERLIDQTDYYIVIIGHRYGTLTEEGISYTEKEYDYAKENNVPIMAFIQNRNAPKAPSEREAKASLNKKLEAFIAKASDSKMCQWWDNEDDLATKVALALPKEIITSPRIGWVRGDTAITPEVANELAASASEIRSLSAELDTLKKSIVVKEPGLELSIDGDWNLQLSAYKELARPTPLEASQVPSHLIEEVDEFQLAEYNRKIPTEDEMVEFNWRRRIILESENNAYIPSFKVSNNGTAKANDIVVTIDFPPELGVLSKYDHKELDRQFGSARDEVITNPIEKADKEYRKRKQRNSNIYGLGLGNMYASPVPMAQLHSGKVEIDDSHVEGKTVTIRINSLIHTRSYSINEGIRVFPIKPGKAEVKVSIICEELAEPITLSMPVEVTEEDAEAPMPETV